MSNRDKPDTAATPPPHRERAKPSVQRPHLLKNGAPAHVLTIEDRRKGAETTNANRRLLREIYEDEKLTRQLEVMFARDEARRQRKHAQYLARRARQRRGEEADEPRPSRPWLRVVDDSGRPPLPRATERERELARLQEEIDRRRREELGLG